MSRFLIVGGAGYIGSHVVKELLDAGHEVVVLDNLFTGYRQAVTGGEFIHGDVRDARVLDQVFATRKIDCVMHFAAFIEVGESVKRPLKYYLNNTTGAINLLEAMRQNRVRRFIFSSTAAVYGDPEQIPILETEQHRPTSPYGCSKGFVEQILKDSAHAHGLQYTALRYFNAAGADESGVIGEAHRPESHLIPLVLQVALGQREQIKIFGTDWDTPDGTCIRDYVHVTDLARAHILAAEHLMDGGDSGAYNLGCQAGYSVKEIIDIARQVTGHPIPAEEAPRRPGDPERLVASSERIKAILGWQPVFEDPERIIATAWRWHSQHPNGY